MDGKGGCPVLWDNLDGGGDWTQPNSDSNREEDKVLIHKLKVENDHNINDRFAS